MAVGALLALAACGSPATVQPGPTVTSRADVAVDKQAVPVPEVPPTWPLTGVAGAPTRARRSR
ncbi:hypothetical protein [Cellulomonas sp. S1-8]|uniref:hypothetical protein n=1 Tax=Cellulomonas sp. S1-8 TaxID=2904790 RepID=UPI0022439646|nr:hypothetical protein [Cellulomonas sp. S1-8]UZN02322.1 hypothetical protein OKX07_14710 [Cellulomonas sp. S1-8]